ncbi:MAG: hypothetical protein EZS28_056603, partial [Streblomastix strix]
SIQSDKDALTILAKAVATQASKVLGIAPTTNNKDSGDAQIASEIPLSQYGLDSLTAVEMKNWTEKNIHVDVPVVDFVRGPSSEQLAKTMLQKFYEKYGRPKTIRL